MNKRPDLVVLIAIWQFLGAFGILLLVTAVMGMMWFVPWSGRVGGYGWETDFPVAGGFVIAVMSFAALVLAAYFILAVVGGIGLLQGREWGRVLSIVNAVMSMFWIPVGTILGVLILVYLVRPEVRVYYQGDATATP